MARTEARILVSIWSDPDFRALTPNAQWTYMFLLSQPDLAHTGVIPLRVRRWAQAAEGMTIEAIREALRLLESARFIVADRDSEELLVRSFIRRDKVFKQPQVFRAAADSLPLVTSGILRRALAEELARVSEEDMVPGSRDILADMRAALPEPDGQGAPHPDGHPAPDPAPSTPGVRGVVTAVTTVAPLPVPPDPEPLPPSAAVALRGEPTAQTIVGEWISSLPGKAAKRVTGQIASHVKALLGEGFDPDQVREGLAAWQAHGQTGPSLLPSFVHQIANGGSGSRASPKRSTTDDRVSAALALAERFDRGEIGT